MAVVFSIFSWAFFFFLVFMTRKGVRKKKQMATWPIVTGEITSNEQVWESNGDATFLMLYLTFSYRIDDVSYTSGISFHLNNSLGLNSSLAKLKPGKSVLILYNPLDKQESVLKKYNQNMIYEVLPAAYLMLMLAIISTWLIFY